MAKHIVIVAAILCALLIWINRRQIFRAVGWLVLAFILFAAYLNDTESRSGARTTNNDPSAMSDCHVSNRELSPL